MNVSQNQQLDLGGSVTDGIRVASIAMAAYEYVTLMMRQLLFSHSSTFVPHWRQLSSHPSCGVAVLEVSASAKPNKVGSIPPPTRVSP